LVPVGQKKNGGEKLNSQMQKACSGLAVQAFLHGLLAQTVPSVLLTILSGQGSSVAGSCGAVFAPRADGRSFIPRMKCSCCGGNRVDVRPNWKEQPVQSSLTGKQWW
jgi:hypothetical protein